MNKHKLRLALVTVCAILAMAVAFTMSAYHSFKNIILFEANRAEADMADVSELGSERMESALDGLIGEARAAARLVSLVGEESEQLFRCFDPNLAQSPYDAALLLGGDGQLRYGAYDYLSVFSDCAAKAQSSGEPCVSDIALCADGASRFGVSVPFSEGGGSFGSVTLLYPAGLLGSVTDEALLGGSASLCLFAADGSALLPSEVTPWLLTDTPAALADGSARRCLAQSGEDSLVLVSPVRGSSWYLACGVPMSYIYSRAETSFKTNNTFMLVIFLVLSAIIIGSVLLLSSRSRRLTMEKERFAFAANQSNRAVFEYRRDRDRLRLLGSCESISLPDAESSAPLAHIIDLLAPDDRRELDKAIRILSEECCTQVTLRMAGLRGSEEYHWYHITAEELSHSGGTIVIGTIEDIDEREKERIDLLRKAVSDPLTGLYNRAETERMINEQLASLEGEQSGTFCIIDMDNFKLVNDTNGHDCGDRALLFFSHRLRQTFRGGDIIGRLGGDEFVVYMHFTSDREAVLRRFDELMDSLSVRENAEEASLPELACSIGCVNAQPGDTFAIVYNLADKALYRAKTSGKRKAEFEETA